MPIEPRPSQSARPGAGTPASGSAPTPAEAELMDALVVFLRTVPVYPDGHQRVAAAAARLKAALEGARIEHDSIELRVKPNSLWLQGRSVDLKGAGRREVRNALAATAVARLGFDAETPPASLVKFARTLHENVKKTRGGGMTFADLWPQAIPGVRVAEQTFSTSGFGGNEGDVAAEGEDPTDRGGPAVDVGGRGGGGPDVTDPGDDGPPTGPTETDEDAEPGSRVGSVAAEVRRRVLANEGARAVLERLELRVADRFEADAIGPDSDLLEEVLRLLPGEARRDPEAGRLAVERVLARFSRALEVGIEPDDARDLHAHLGQTVALLFPSGDPAEPDADAPPAPRAPAERPPPRTSEDVQRDRERAMPEDLDVLRREAAADPDLGPTAECTDAAEPVGVILVNTLLDAPDPVRRDALRKRVVAVLKESREGPEAAAFAAHVRVEVARGDAERDPARLAFLASTLEEAGLDELAASCGMLSPAIVSVVFPHLVRAYWRRSGGLVGRICRLVGRPRVLEAAPILLSPGGLLAGPGADRVLSERTRDVLPMAEACLSADDPVLRDLTVRAMRSIDLPSAAAAALRAVEPAGLPTAFLRGLCEEGFDGHDTHRYDAPAIDILRRVVEAPPGRIPLAARLYAIAALGAFDRAAVEATLRALLGRRLLLWPAQSKEIRRAAEAALHAGATAKRAPEGGKAA